MTLPVKILKLLKLLFALFILCTIVLMFLAYSMVMPQGTGAPVLFQVSPGESAAEISRNLAHERIIGNALSFRLLLRLARAEDRIKAGTYELTPAMNSLAILKMLVNGQVKERSFTAPEGASVEDIAVLLESTHVMTAEEFRTALKEQGSFQVGSLTIGNPEGFLFPDTYQVPCGIKPDFLIEKMLQRFEEQILPLYQASALSAQFSLPELVTMASLVEREARLDHERPLIAAVYYNRLRKGMLLQCDATVQYALGRTKPVLSFDDLEIESPYNTYLHQGLPPGPICNPGIKSFKAACSPGDVPSLYYVVDEVKGDGSHVFSTTFHDHQEALHRYRKD
ncbi:MAG: endolytic transglycosylase MltG [Candidatus Eremiobacteraeota bacterium]|nr:endolytic transglycosylase MltG [Candidatus Eremiobacteraeota bacterium]